MPQQSLPDQWGCARFDMRDKIKVGYVNNFFDVACELELLEDWHLLMSTKRIVALSIHPNLRSASHMGHCSRERGLWLGKIDLREVREQMVFFIGDLREYKVIEFKIMTCITNFYSFICCHFNHTMFKQLIVWKWDFLFYLFSMFYLCYLSFTQIGWNKIIDQTFYL